MCLTTIKEIPINTNKGYKLFRKFTKTYTPVFQCTDISYILNTWTTDKNNYRIRNQSNETYFTGFHIFLTLEDVKGWLGTVPICDNEVYCEVEFEDVVTSGMQDGYPCVVAKKMRIIKECV